MCDDDVEYNSGPFCQHWSDPSDCDDLCVCGHKCCQHYGNEECTVEEGFPAQCPCQEFRDASE